jgi:uncharacterized membrane protein YqjE
LLAEQDGVGAVAHLRDGVGFHQVLEVGLGLVVERGNKSHGCRTLVLTLLVVFGLSMGFILLTIFLVALFWERGWIGAIGGLSFIYLGVAAIAAFKLRNVFLRRSALFPATLEELGKDRDRLKG